jgi:hypothetical protein
MWWFAWMLAPDARADAPGWRYPSSVVGISAGSPSLLSVRGEQWLADDIEAEVGAGLRALEVEPVSAAFDWALRWRPDVACLGCGGRALVSFGVGPGGTVVPGPGFEGPIAFAVGGDVGANLVIWLNPNLGLNLSGRGGGGVGWTGSAVGDLAGAGWGMGTVGFAF